MSLHELPARTDITNARGRVPANTAKRTAGEVPWPPVSRDPLPREKFQEVVVSSDPAVLEQYAGLWETLAANAVEPNVFYEHWSLLPALRLLANGQVQVLLVIERDPNAGMKSQLIGVFPLEACKSFHRLPLGGMRFWRHPHCYLCNPLIAKGYESVCWQKLFQWLREQPAAGHFIEMPTVRADGSLMRSFEAFCFAEQLPFYLSELYGRALMEVGPGTGEDYLRATMGGDHRRQYARKKKQLAQKGDLQFHVLKANEASLEAWVDEFLGVESSGWKKDASTAMACKAADREYFHTICREAHARQRLMMMKLTLDGRPIAGHMAINAGQGSFALKIAYDESLGACSPGVLLEIEAIHELHRSRSCQWVDSCSACNGVAMKRVWKQERRISGVICPVGKSGGRLIVAALPLIRYMRNRLSRYVPKRRNASGA